MISEAAILLAGFVLAHAAWSVSDLPEGELLTPLAGIARAGERQFIRFEAETQAEAIANGKAWTAEWVAEGATWAFAREGLIRNDDGSAVDVITVEAWQPGLDAPIIFVQPFQPFASGKFKLLETAWVIVDGQRLEAAEAAPYLEVLRRGIDSHQHVAPLWPGWQ